MKYQISAATLVFALTMLLAGCGGGGGGSTPTPIAATSAVQGTVAYGKPVVGATVSALDVSGKQCGTATTGNGGAYSMTLQCAPGPVEFVITAGGPANLPLMAMAFPQNSSSQVSGTVNITTLTTLIVYAFIGTQTIAPGLNNPGSPQQTSAYITQLMQMTYQNQTASAAYQSIYSAYQSIYTTILSSLGQILSTYGINTSNFNPVTSGFTANGQGIDGFYDNNQLALFGANSIIMGPTGSPVVSVTYTAGGVASIGGSAFQPTQTNPTTGATVYGVQNYLGANQSCTSGCLYGYYASPQSACSAVAANELQDGFPQYSNLTYDGKGCFDGNPNDAVGGYPAYIYPTNTPQ